MPEADLLYRAKCKKYDRQSTMQTILSTLEAPYIPEEPSSPTDASMQDSIATPPETPSKALGYQLANAGLDSAKGVGLIFIHIWLASVAQNASIGPAFES